MATSTSGSIATTIAADSLTAPKLVVVREDIYKGATLVGTTYRNVNFTSLFVTPIPSITFNSVATTFNQAQANASPTNFSSTTNSTVLTFTNSTVPANYGEWDNSLMTITVT